MRNIFKEFILKQKLKENGYPLLKVKKEIIHQYRETTRNNKSLTDFEIRFKIVRAFYCGGTNSKNNEREIIDYGYLQITKSNITDMITEIHNSRDNRNGHIKFKIKNEITFIYNSVFGGEM